MQTTKKLRGFYMNHFLENTMAYMNWEEVKAAGEKKLPVLFPLGVIEEHGPHLPLGSDILWCKSLYRSFPGIIFFKT